VTRLLGARVRARTAELELIGRVVEVAADCSTLLLEREGPRRAKWIVPAGDAQVLSARRGNGTRRQGYASRREVSIAIDVDAQEGIPGGE